MSDEDSSFIVKKTDRKERKKTDLVIVPKNNLIVGVNIVCIPTTALCFS